MKTSTLALFITSASAAVIQLRQNGGLLLGDQTLVLKESGGVPGNECITFRNNGIIWSICILHQSNSHGLGEMVDAACVNTAADRQLTPSTISGSDVLAVQRTFTAGFRQDLVGKEVCVGFNGTTFLAQDCASSNLDPVSFVRGELRSASGACQSGHDDAAQITVDPTGLDCARLTSTTVTPTVA